MLIRSATAGVVFRHACHGHAHPFPNHLTGLYGHFFSPLLIEDVSTYDHDGRDTGERDAHGSGIVRLFLFFDRRPSFLTQADVPSRLLCENPVVRDKNFPACHELGVSELCAEVCLVGAFAFRFGACFLRSAASADQRRRFVFISLDFSLEYLSTCAWGRTHNYFFLECTRGSTCGWSRVHTFSGGTQCIDHCCGSFGHGSVRNMRPALSVAFLVCSMSATVIRTPYVGFCRMSGSVASE